MDRSYYEEIYDFKENLKNSSYKKKIRKVIKKGLSYDFDKPYTVFCEL